MDRTFNPCDDCRYGKERRDGNGNDAVCKACEFQALLRRTAEYDKLQAEGRLVVLPCKVGDALFQITNEFNGKGISKMIIRRIINEIRHNNLNENTIVSKQPHELHFLQSQIGKTVFLTREEAEAALKESK